MNGILLPTRDPDAEPVFESSLYETGSARLLRTLLWDGMLQARGDDSPGLTQPEAARRSGVSKQSVKNYQKDLSGALLNGSLAISGTVGYALGVDFGRTHAVRVGLTNMRGHILHDTERGWAIEPNEDPATGSATDHDELGLLPSEMLRKAVERVKTLLDRWGVDPRDLVGVGIGLATPEVGATPSEAALGDWMTRDPAENLREALIGDDENTGWEGVPMTADNDTNLSAIYNHLWGLETANDTIYVKWMAGVRAALILDGRLYRGWSGAAGELPHVEIDHHDVPTCGASRCRHERGCLYGAAPIDRLREYVSKKVDEPVLWADEIMAKVNDKNVGGEIRAHIERIGDAIGRAVAPLATGLNPRLIVMGGAMGARAYPVILDRFAAGFQDQTNLRLGAPNKAQSGGGDVVIITRSAEKNRTTVQGAAALALIEFGVRFLLDRGRVVPQLRRVS